MPEGPELHLASRFVNDLGRKHIFTGKVEKSAVSTKNPDVDWDEKSYVISAQSRGKEVKLTLTEFKTDDKSKSTKTIKPPNSMDILFRFGMSGKFTFTKANDKPKHAHLNFFTVDDDMVLSFVDYRRFGRWEVNGDWSQDRGPCVLQEYPEFRLSIPPFVSARSVLEKLVTDDQVDEKKIKVKSQTPDFLQLCNIVPLEVVNLGGTGYDPDTGTGDLTDFQKWLRCYYNPDMKNMADHNGRTMWFCGEAGPLKPKETKMRGMKRSKKNKKSVKEESVPEELHTPQKKKGKAPMKSTESDTKPVASAKSKRKMAAENQTPASTPVKNSRLTRGKLTKVLQNGNSPYFTNTGLKQPKTTKRARFVNPGNTPKAKPSPKASARRRSSQTTVMVTSVNSPASGRGLRRSARNKPKVSSAV